MKTSAQVSANDKNSPKTTKPQVPQPPNPPVKEDVEMGENDVRIDGERIETKDIIVDKGRVIFKNPNKRPRIQDGKPPLTIEQIRNLPPAQRRRVRRILQQNNPPDNLPPNN